MWKMGQDILWYLYIAKHFQYLQPLLTLWIYVLISDTIILNKPFLKDFFCDFDLYFVFTKNACFLCVMCSNVTALCSLSLKKTMQDPILNRQVCTEFINVIMENNWLHKSDANSTLYNAGMKGFPLSSSISIWTSPICFAVTKCLSTTLIYLSVSSNESGIKSKISGVMWKFTLEYKTQLVSCELYP